MNDSRIAPSKRAEDVDALFARWRDERDTRARDELVSRFLPLARQLALRYARAPEPLDDLVQVATLGLLGAIDRFDPQRGPSFRSFAVPTMLGELKRHFRDHCWSLHVPRTEQELALKVRNGDRNMTGTLGRRPTIDELARHLSLPVDQVCEGLEVIHASHGLSLDAPVTENVEDGETSLGEMLGAADDGYELVDMRVSLESAMRGLPDRERELLALRLGGQLTQREIGDRFGVSQMQVSRLLRGALAHLHELADLPPEGIAAPRRRRRRRAADPPNRRCAAAA